MHNTVSVNINQLPSTSTIIPWIRKCTENC